MATNAAVVLADLASNRWNGNSLRPRLVQSWDIVAHYYRWRHCPDDRKVVELVEHGVVVLDNDAVGKHELGRGGTENTREQDGEWGGCHDVEEEEDRGTKDDDTANTADPEYSHDDKVVEVDENDIGRKEDGDIVTVVSETVVHRGTRYGSVPNHPPLDEPWYLRRRGWLIHLLLLPQLLPWSALPPKYYDYLLSEQHSHYSWVLRARS